MLPFEARYRKFLSQNGIKTSELGLGVIDRGEGDAYYRGPA